MLSILVVAESSGGWGPSAVSTFSKWAKLATKRGYASSSPKVVLPQFFERLCVSFRAVKTRAVKRRAHTSADVSVPLIAQALDAAAAVLGSFQLVVLLSRANITDQQTENASGSGFA